MQLPPACYTMSSKEKDLLLGVLKGTKVPDSYSSNISWCVKLKQRKLIRGSLPKNVSQVIIDLCHYFREICLKVLKVSHLEELEKEKIRFTLCQMEKIFLPGFFTFMVHLVTHLENEAKLAGPLHYRWMYPIEKYLLLTILFIFFVLFYI